MRCPQCRADDTKVIDSREAEDGSAIRRRRACGTCAYRFTTYERLDEVPLLVSKSNGSREPFDRAKLIAGVSAACKGRPVSAEQIELLADALEEHVRVQGPEVASAEIGLEVLDHLRGLDEVAYLRFASVYKDFDAAADFQRELVLLKKLQQS
ncbi:MAG TPA: transcriptional regulator NrdR [Ilumatobacteraceae bacterium]|nr:transcriptional regulator NrdR [Ilumatobacteraceae bacterium]